MPLAIGPYSDAHRTPSGPGDARPTAYQILKDNDVIGKLTDKTFLVTGGTDGLGLETVRQLAKTGAYVFFTARSELKAEKVIQDLKKEGQSDAELKGAKIDWVKIDNISLKSVEEGAKEFLRKSNQLNVLVCNAGIGNPPTGRSEDGFETQFAVNHLAHFYLFQLLKSVLLKSSTPAFQSRVVSVSSAAHCFSTVQIGNYNLEKPLKGKIDPLTEIESDYNPMIAYGQSKTANIWMSNEIERRYGGSGLHGLSVHPGTIMTAGVQSLDPHMTAKIASLFETEGFRGVLKSVEQGAATHVLAAVGKDFEGKGGMYLNNVGVATAVPDDGMISDSGYRSWAYDQEGAKRLWTDSLEMVGVKNGQFSDA